MKLLETDYFGLGVGFNYLKFELSIHIFIWCLDIKILNKKPVKQDRL